MSLGQRDKRCQRDTIARHGTLIPHAVAAQFDPLQGRLIVALSSGVTVSLDPREVRGLENALPCDLEEIQITPSGFGLHFPRIDADLYLPGLLEKPDPLP
jgi:Protein of unknown function (DUF2442)